MHGLASRTISMIQRIWKWICNKLPHQIVNASLHFANYIGGRKRKASVYILQTDHQRFVTWSFSTFNIFKHRLYCIGHNYRWILFYMQYQLICCCFRLNFHVEYCHFINKLTYFNRIYSPPLILSLLVSIIERECSGNLKPS